MIVVHDYTCLVIVLENFFEVMVVYDYTCSVIVSEKNFEVFFNALKIQNIKDKPLMMNIMIV